MNKLECQNLCKTFSISDEDINVLDNIDFAFGVGGDDKKNSSSSILKKYLYSSEERVWGKFFNLFEEKHTKVKELIISPEKGMSYQKHNYRIASILLYYTKN